MKKMLLWKVCCAQSRLGKFLLPWKLILLLLLIGNFQVSASEYAKNVKFSLKMQNAEVVKVLWQIQQQSEFDFIYNNDDLEKLDPVDLDVNDVGVEYILDECLQGSDMEYQIKDKVIVISPAPRKTPAKQQQKSTITGQVVDESGIPLPGVSVVVKGTTTGVTTTVDGEYAIEVPGTGAVLIFSFVGMNTQEIQLGSKRIVNVVLTTKSEGLDEVVIVGYGTQRKESVVGSISTIDVEKLPVPGASISNSLAGQLSGIVAMTRSGEPGKKSAAEFYIRGISSFTGKTEPLVLVDGIERELDLVDTEDIESFSVLKDASASAVYGVRGANGVILIKTKSGSFGKPSISVRGEMGITSPTIMPKLANSYQFAEMYNEASGTNYYTEEDLEKYRSGSDPDLYPNVNWIDELYKSQASNQRINMNVSGGGKIANYYVSGSYYTENSIFKDAGDIYDYNSSIKYDKFNFRANIDFNLSKSTVLNVNLANVYEKSFGPGRKTDDIWYYAFATSPNAFPVEYSDGTISAPSTSSGYNPWNLLVHSGYREQFWNSSQSLIGITEDLARITKGLKVNIKFSWDAFNTTLQERTKEPKQYNASGRDEEGNLIYGNPIYEGSETLDYNKESWGSRTTYLEASMTYNRLFNEVHRLGGLFLYNHKIHNNTQAGSQAESLPYKHQGIAGRVTYAFKDKYFLEYNMGYNGSENFARGHRFGFFPAGAIGWMVSNEEWFQPVTHIVDQLKLKASHGKVGNDDIGGGRRWIYEPTIFVGRDDKPEEQWYHGQTGNVGGVGIRVGDVENLSVSWEEVTKSNFGVEIGFFNALKIQADYFEEKREGVFLRRAGLPGLAGLSSIPYVNIGKSENKGFDGSLEFSKKIGEVHLTARGSFTYARNTLLDNDEPDWQYKYQNKTGKSIGQPFGLIALGLFESQEQIDNSPRQSFGEYRVGDVRYLDVNGDGVVNSYDQVAIGYPKIPEIIYGLGLNAQWKNFDVNVFFQGVDNTSFYVSGTAMEPFSSNNMERGAFHDVLYHESWKTTNTLEQNANANYPRLSIGGGPGSSNNYQQSTMNQRDGSFLRLKNVEIGYTLPKGIFGKAFLDSGRIYVRGTNLYTWSDFDLWDPERGEGDGSGYPPNRVVAVGFSTKF